MRERRLLGVISIVGLLLAGLPQFAWSHQQVTMRADTTLDDRTVAERLTDLTAATRIRKAFAADTQLRVFAFEVEVLRGVATLRSLVETEEERRRAVRLASAVPGIRSVLADVRLRDEPPDARAVMDPAPPHAPEVAAAPDSTAAASDEVYHTVQSGESLWLIARRYDTSIRRLKALNDLRSNTLRPGQRLRIR